jgi:hypothetical protein
MEPRDYRELSLSERKSLRQQYIVEQGERCYHCKGFIYDQPPLEIMAKKLNMKLFPKGFLDHPIHLHHNHTTGMTIGAVHARCNAVLWQYHGE